MTSEASGISQPVSEKGSSAAAVIARQDRIPIWSLSYLFIGIIGIGFLFTFYDIFDVTVSFIQTCVQIVPGCTPVNASNYLGLPVELNLAGYVVGALILAPLADRFGRRDMLLFTLLLTGIGSLYTAFVGDYTNFVIARTVLPLSTVDNSSFSPNRLTTLLAPHILPYYKEAFHAPHFKQRGFV